MAQESVSNPTHPDRQELRRQITQQLGLTIALVGAVIFLAVGFLIGWLAAIWM